MITNKRSNVSNFPLLSTRQAEHVAVIQSLSCATRVDTNPHNSIKIIIPVHLLICVAVLPCGFPWHHSVPFKGISCISLLYPCAAILEKYLPNLFCLDSVGGLGWRESLQWVYFKYIFKVQNKMAAGKRG